MISNLTKCAENFLKVYEKEGRNTLVNCQEYPEFQELIGQLKLLTKENVGITTANYDDHFSSNKISYFNIREDNELCIGVFCLSKGTRLTLHDHPSMMVVSRVLCGKLQRRSLDLLDKSSQFTVAKKVYVENDYNPIGTILDAKINSDEIFSGGDVLALTPEKGNLHALLALEDTALLDILLPNYDNENRFCNFYYELDSESEIAEFPNPKSLLNRDPRETKKDKLIHLLNSNLDSDSDDEAEDKQSDESLYVKVIYALPPSDLDIEILPYKGDPLV